MTCSSCISTLSGVDGLGGLEVTGLTPTDLAIRMALGGVVGGVAGFFLKDKFGGKAIGIGGVAGALLGVASGQVLPSSSDGVAIPGDPGVYVGGLLPADGGAIVDPTFGQQPSYSDGGSFFAQGQQQQPAASAQTIAAVSSGKVSPGPSLIGQKTASGLPVMPGRQTSAIPGVTSRYDKGGTTNSAGPLKTYVPPTQPTQSKFSKAYSSPLLSLMQSRRSITPTAPSIPTPNARTLYGMNGYFYERV